MKGSTGQPAPNNGTQSWWGFAGSLHCHCFQQAQPMGIKHQGLFGKQQIYRCKLWGKFLEGIGKREQQKKDAFILTRQHLQYFPAL